MTSPALSPTPDRQKRIQTLLQQLKERILVLDGAMGTAIQNYDLSEADFGGAAYYGCNEHLCLTRPDVIEAIYRGYLEAGCDIIETNTFGATPMVLDEFDLKEKASEINLAAARLARKVADEFSTPKHPRFVAGSIGPTTKAISVTGGISFEQLQIEFFEQAKSLHAGGVDYFLLETCQDTRNIKAGLLAIDRLFASGAERIPIAVSVTIEPMGTMLAGQSIDALAASLEHIDLLYIGLNCATGPLFMTDHIRTLAAVSSCRIACVPNAGLPDSDGQYLETPSMMVNVMQQFCREGWINLLGGCCGTGPQHIQAFSDLAQKSSPRSVIPQTVSTLSGLEFLEVTEEKRPLLVGERTNVVGSRKFKDLISNQLFEEASEIARLQVKNGAHIVDVCLANPDRDEFSDMRAFMEEAVKRVKAPFMIDSTDAKVIELALTYCQGKAIINSINLEDGLERFETIVPLAKRYGAALVVGCIDDDPQQGMAVTADRKLAVAQRSFDILTKEFGVKPQDIYFDALVFPCATGDQNYLGSANHTVDGVSLIKKQFPLSKVILGISNVSFGLPPAGREILNSVFLFHCVKAGLDLAIVNTERLERYASIPEAEKKMAEELLFNTSDDVLAAFVEHFRKQTTKAKSSDRKEKLEDRLAQYIIEGTKEGLIDDLNLALKNHWPLDIINGPLMKGMDEVGRLFNNNELIVAEVLQSAESMKKAVSHLEPFMEKGEESERASILLATVKGDVHDIGKNLVEIIFKNNGFRVINLGIKVPPEQLIEAVKEHQPTMIGLSGLLVKSCQQMVITAEDLKRVGIALPVLVGGAALSQTFVDLKISPMYSGFVEYAKDAMSGLDLARKMLEPSAFESIRQVALARRQARQTQSLTPKIEKPKKQISELKDFPKVSDWDRHILNNLDLDAIWAFINPLMLYGKHLGIKGSIVKKVLQGERSKDSDLQKAWEVFDTLESVKEICRREEILKPQGIYQFFRARTEGEAIVLAGDDAFKTIQARFQFPRQLSNEGLCLSDFVSSTSWSDSLCLFVTSAGEGTREKARAWRESGEYLKSFALEALALETAEALAEFLHAKIRHLWGFPDDPHLTMMERFQARYRGKRYSFGYPACPELKDQGILFDLLRPQDIGVQLTDGFMMEPEASVSALVFHHPQAQYFGAQAGENE